MHFIYGYDKSHLCHVAYLVAELGKVALFSPTACFLSKGNFQLYTQPYVEQLSFGSKIGN